MQEIQVQSLGQEDPLEKEIANHCSILACEIPWTEESGRSAVLGSQKSWTQLSNYTTITINEGLETRRDLPKPQDLKSWNWGLISESLIPETELMVKKTGCNTPKRLFLF